MIKSLYVYYEVWEISSVRCAWKKTADIFINIYKGDTQTQPAAILQNFLILYADHSNTVLHDKHHFPCWANEQLNKKPTPFHLNCLRDDVCLNIIHEIVCKTLNRTRLFPPDGSLCSPPNSTQNCGLLPLSDQAIQEKIPLILDSKITLTLLIAAADTHPAEPPLPPRHSQEDAQWLKCALDRNSTLVMGEVWH